MYVDKVLEKAEADPTVSKKAAVYISAFRKAVEAEDKVLKVSPKDKLSDLIAQADSRRGALYRSFKNVLPGFAKEKPGELHEAAVDLQQLVTDYAINPNDPMLVESGLLKNFVHDLETRLKTQVETLGLGILVTRLKEANDEVNRLMVERTEKRQGNVIGALAAARKVTDEAYVNLIGMVNGLVYAEGEEAYRNFVDYVNAEIIYFRREALGQKTTGPKADGSGTGSDDTGSGEPGTETPGGSGGTGNPGGGTGGGTGDSGDDNPGGGTTFE